ncbi:MAG: 4a-hydroxytetrahydrobiopterin dehydratase [Candidatus Levybacteria bacterium]|nr:4a-hydroxytetrahydrobiopterin dehydratase [Candidatus Levybacteria bacterium]
MDLTKKRCEPCEGGTKPFGSKEIETYMTYLKTPWEASEDLRKIERKFKFKDFKEAMKFVNKVAELAEQEGHHPNIFNSYNRVTITLWTHAINGLSINDFIMASKTELLE